MGFNLSVSNNQGKKSIVVTKSTILLFGFENIRKIGEQTPDVQLTRNWIEKGNTVVELIENIEDYEVVQRMSQVNKNVPDKAYCIENCYVISFGANCSF